MEVVDNAILLIIPGAMEAGLGDLLFWGALSFALAVAFVLTVPVNRWLIARGKGHTAVHETGIHGGPPTAGGRRRGDRRPRCSAPRCWSPRRSTSEDEGAMAAMTRWRARRESRGTRHGGRRSGVAEPVRPRPLSERERRHPRAGRSRAARRVSRGELAFRGHRRGRRRRHRLRSRAREADAPDRRPRGPDRVPASAPADERGRHLVDADHAPRRGSLPRLRRLRPRGREHDARRAISPSTATPLEELPAPAATASAGDGYEVAIEGAAPPPASRGARLQGQPRRRAGRGRALPRRRRPPRRPARGRPRVPTRPPGGVDGRRVDPVRDRVPERRRATASSSSSRTAARCAPPHSPREVD